MKNTQAFFRVREPWSPTIGDFLEFYHSSMASYFPSQFVPGRVPDPYRILEGEILGGQNVQKSVSFFQTSSEKRCRPKCIFKTSYEASYHLINTNCIENPFWMSCFISNLTYPLVTWLAMEPNIEDVPSLLKMEDFPANYVSLPEGNLLECTKTIHPHWWFLQA